MTIKMPEFSFVFPARVLKVVDGDTVDFELDQGMHSRRIERVRLLGINTPETKGETRLAGLAAKDFVSMWLSIKGPKDLEAWPFLIQTEKDDAFGRYLGHIWRRYDGEYLNGLLLQAGYAVEFMK